MENRITNLEIQHFKSIREMKLGCKRINLFIGKPNVGKSNILEAVSLLGAGYERNTQKYLSSFIRYEEFNNLFFDQDLSGTVRVVSDLGVASLSFYSGSAYILILSDEKKMLDIPKGIDIWLREKGFENLSPFQAHLGYLHNELSTNHDGLFFQIIPAEGSLNDNYKGSFTKPVKKYDFQKLEKHENKFFSFLQPPHGDNLFTILQFNKSFHKEIASLFREYGLELVLRIKEHKLEIQKNIDGIIYSYPYSTIADTLQRIIFYLTAIESNHDSVLLFEEPEAHAFPPYTRMLADRIVHDEKNQYFITTHSPYLLHTIIENTSTEDLAVFIVYFEQYETKVKMLSSEDLRDILDESIDVFFNLDRFVADEVGQ